MILWGVARSLEETMKTIVVRYEAMPEWADENGS